MAKSFNIKIITPAKMVYEGDIVSLIAPSELGYVGILADHAPFIASLVKGKIILREASDKTTTFNLQETGFMEVLKNNVTIFLKNL